MSNYSDNIFEVNDKRGTLEINKKEVRQFPEFRVILERDRGGVINGDSDGRRKYLAFRELYYIYIMADPFNKFSVLNDKRRQEKALEQSKLIELKWKPDKVIKEAIEAYKDYLRLSPIAHALINSQQSLYNIGKDIEMYEQLNDRIRNEIKILQNTLYDDNAHEEDKQEAEAKINSLLGDLSKNTKEVFNLSNTLPDRHKNIEDLKVKLAEEDSELDLVTGGRTIFRREDPN